MKYLVFILTTIISISAAAQKKTAFYDFYWKPTAVDQARFYSVTEKTDSGWLRRDYYINGMQIQMEALYKDSACTIQHGHAYYFHPNGKPSIIGSKTDDKLNGVCVSYYSNGMLADSATYKNNIPVGCRYSWHRNGFMSDSTGHANDSMDVQITWYDDGAISSAGYWLKNKKQGKWQYWHRNGNLAGLELYNHGKLIDRQYFEPDKSLQPDTAKANSAATFKKGGSEGWKKYVARSSYWPPNTKLVNTNSVTVGVQFTINEEGKPENIEIYCPFLPQFDNAAIDIIKTSPAWNPAIAQNRKIKTTLRQPITFQQEE